MLLALYCTATSATAGCLSRAAAVADHPPGLRPDIAAAGRTAGEYAAEPGKTAADLQQVSHFYGLDQPAPVRYLCWLGGMLWGDSGIPTQRINRSLR